MASPRASTILTAVLASIAIGGGELAVVALRHAEVHAGALASLALFAFVSSAIVGLIAGSIACIGAGGAGRGLAAACAGWVLLIAAHRPLAPGSTLTWNLVGVAAAAGFAWLVGSLVLRVVWRVPAFASPRGWSALALAAALSIALLGYARRPESGTRPESAAGQRAQLPSILLVTIDTLRADYLGCYGRSQARTPTLDALAAQGILFENAMTHCVTTGPSHATILTGLVPAHHGVIENLQRLEPAVRTVNDDLLACGYRTGAFVSGYPLRNCSSAMLERFDHWDDDFRVWRALPSESASLLCGRYLRDALAHWKVDHDPRSRSAQAVTDAATQWIAETSDGPFFAWVHYFDPHLPYEPPRDLLSPSARAYRGPADGQWYRLTANERTRILEDPAALAHMNELYDAEVAAVDRELLRVLDTARASAGPGGLWIFVTSDHGESFGEHGIFYERDLYEDSLHVPLIVVPPAERGAGRRVEALVGLVDLAPTLLELAGAQREVDGRSLLPLLGAGTGEAESARTYVAEVFPSTGVPFRRPAYAVREALWKLIARQRGWNNAEFQWRSDEAREVYDLSADHAELHDLSSTEVDRARAMEERGTPLRRKRASAPLTLDEREREHLKELGYSR